MKRFIKCAAAAICLAVAGLLVQSAVVEAAETTITATVKKKGNALYVVTKQATYRLEGDVPLDLVDRKVRLYGTVQKGKGKTAVLKVSRYETPKDKADKSPKKKTAKKPRPKTDAKDDPKTAGKPAGKPGPAPKLPPIDPDKPGPADPPKE